MNQRYLEHDLSVRHGLAKRSKDFYWLERSVPCQHACPARTDIPGYLEAVASGDFDKAYRINLRDNVFPAILGRICTRPCEEVCRHGYEGLGDSVAICFSKRSAADFQSTTQLHILPTIYPLSGKKVAVIGSGPSGLAAARDLCLLGHAVSVYEQYHLPGGMLTQNIPPFRLPREIVIREIEQIEKQGVQIHCGQRVGLDIKFKELMNSSDALIIAGGCSRPNTPAISGLDAKGVLHGSDFLQAVLEGEKNLVGRRVIVIGGGFTAVDCARAAVRCGAESVTIYYRRQREDMKLTPGEFETLGEEGIGVVFLVSPRAVQVDHGRMLAVDFVHNTTCPSASGHRTRITALEHSEFQVPADTMLLATGQSPNWEWIEEEHTLPGEGGTWQIDPQHLPHTPNHKLFVAGDQGTGSSSVIEAVASGRQCAREVDRFLMGRKRVHSVVSVTAGRRISREIVDNDIPFQQMPLLAMDQRSILSEVEQGYTVESAQREARRCYVCHYKYEIDSSRCIYCDLCCEVKPLEDCILKVQSLQHDDKRRIVGYIFPVNSFEPENQFEYRINPEACIRCNRCLEVCPVDCIRVDKVSLEECYTDEKLAGGKGVSQADAPSAGLTCPRE